MLKANDTCDVGTDLCGNNMRCVRCDKTEDSPQVCLSGNDYTLMILLVGFENQRSSTIKLRFVVDTVLLIFPLAAMLTFCQITRKLDLTVSNCISQSLQS